MSFTNNQFRLDFPEFANTTAYPDAMITFWSGIGAKRLNSRRWGDLYDQGMELYVAHQITLAKNDQDAATAGAQVGQATQFLQSESAGDVSYSVNTGIGIEDDAGHWNLTTYGRQFYRLMRTVSIGGFQL